MLVERCALAYLIGLHLKIADRSSFVAGTVRPPQHYTSSSAHANHSGTCEESRMQLDNADTGDKFVRTFASGIVGVSRGLGSAW